MKEESSSVVTGLHINSDATTKEEENIVIQQNDDFAKHTESPVDYEAMSRSNHIKNVSMRLEAFMATVDVERKAMEERRKREAAENLEKILRNTRLTFLEFDFTDEELFQLNECVTLFCTDRAVHSFPNIKIYKKDKLKQADIKNFA